MDKQRLTLTALTLLPLAVACGTQPGSGSSFVGAGSTPANGVHASPVTGVHWTVDSLTVDGKTRKAPGSAYLRITEDGRVSGNLGCNGFGSTATVKGDRVDFGEIAMTDMGCQKGPMSFEESLGHTFGGGAMTTEVKGDGLTLTTDAGDRVSLTKENDASLYGTKWTVTALGDENVSRSLPKGVEGKAYFVFDKEHGALSGSLGCNHASARATVRDGHITLGAAKTTRMMCDGSLMDTEKTLLGLFDGTVVYELDHRSLTLTSANGDVVSAVAGE
ncbi:META domain-containing protein [Streptomyces sp. NPDC058272]|uniref:META domain-containing protein n=1 Tax=Streptomyces sp. NPDC058272 TaxID=3346415 RepID=UPI0036E54394